MKDIQLRGHCPCCGHEQAVVRGRMSKHGYQVKHGWFEGVCIGQHYEPVEKNRKPADEIVAGIRAEVARIRARVADLNRGVVSPDKVKSGRKLETVGNRQRWVDVLIPYADGSYYEQERAVENEVRAIEYRAREGESFAHHLKVVADTYHGKPLIEVAKPAAPAPIVIGEKRSNGAVVADVLTVTRIDGARVYWVNGRGFKGWTGTQAFRKLEKVS